MVGLIGSWVKDVSVWDFKWRRKLFAWEEDLSGHLVGSLVDLVKPIKKDV